MKRTSSSDKLPNTSKQNEQTAKKEKKRRAQEISGNSAFEKIFTKPTSPQPLLPQTNIPKQLSASNHPTYICETQYNILNIDWVSIGLDSTVNFMPRIRMFDPFLNNYISFDHDSWLEFTKLEQMIINNFLYSDVTAEVCNFTTVLGNYTTHFEYMFGEKLLCIQYNDTVKKYLKFDVINELFRMKHILMYKLQFLESFNFQKYYRAILQIITNVREHGGITEDNLQHYISTLKDAYLNSDIPKTFLGVCFLETAHFLNDKIMCDMTDMILNKELFALC